MSGDGEVLIVGWVDENGREVHGRAIARLGDNHYVLRDTYGRYSVVRETGAGKTEFVSQPVTVDEALAIAERVFCGGMLRMPVGQIEHKLAIATIALAAEHQLARAA